MKGIDFKWDDKSVEEMLVRAFAERLLQQEYKTPKTIIEDFKSAHTTEVKRDWDIIEFEYVSNCVTLIIPKKYTTGLFTNGFEDMTEHICLSRGYHIRSVKRLSDNEVFSVGDKNEIGIIKSFEIRKGDAMWVIHEKTGNPWDVSCPISELSKPLHRTPLFVSVDGKNIFEGDKWWSVWSHDGSFDITFTDTVNKYDPDFKGKRFSTEEKAEEFVILNKPCLMSLNEVLGLIPEPNWRTIELLMGLAKQKLDKQ